MIVPQFYLILEFQSRCIRPLHYLPDGAQVTSGNGSTILRKLLWKIGILQLHHASDRNCSGKSHHAMSKKFLAFAPILGVDFSPLSFTITRVDG